MSSNLMDTEAGGESNPYEAIKTVTEPHNKSGGQLGDVETASPQGKVPASAEDKAARGEQTASNIRYGQTISEGGMGGQTSSGIGTANTDVGYAQQEAENGSEDAKKARAEQGYGQGKDMDRTIGA